MSDQNTPRTPAPAGDDFDDVHGNDEESISAPLVGRELQPLAMFVILAVFAIVGGGLYAVFGTYWWIALLILIAVPVLLWSLAHARARFIRSYATPLGFTFHPGFPPIPDGLPASSRSAFGFTRHTLTRQEGRLTANTYEHTYRTTRTGGVSRAHGLWWEWPETLFPEFRVETRRPLFDLMFSWLQLFHRRVEQNIVFSDDPKFSKRFRVEGRHEPQIRRLLNPEVRKILLEQMNAGTLSGHRKLLGWDRSGGLWTRGSLTRFVEQGQQLRTALEKSARRS